VIDFIDIQRVLEEFDLRVDSQWLCSLINGSEAAKHGDFPKWKEAIQALPDLNCKRVDCCDSAVTVVASNSGGELETLLQSIGPWRK